MIRKLLAGIGVLVVLPYIVIYYMMKIPVCAAIGFVRGFKDASKETEK